MTVYPVGANDVTQSVVLKSSVLSEDTTYIDSGLYLSLAPNTTYYVALHLLDAANGDGMKFKVVYTGTSTTDGLIYYRPSGAPYQVIIGSDNASTAVDGVHSVFGVVRTSSGGVLSVQFAKNTDVTDDTLLLAGSSLTATRI